MLLKSTETDKTLDGRPILYTPLFVDELQLQNLPDQELDKKFKSATWLFGPLLEELQPSYLCDLDINATTCEQNKQSFKTKFNKFFQPGRIFESDIQLTQCMHELHIMKPSIFLLYQMQTIGTID